MFHESRSYEKPKHVEHCIFAKNRQMGKKANIPETESLFVFREKRKWQIALRRYVLEKKPNPYYAPFFGLDIENMRKWFEYQFPQELGWEDFGKTWQFDHIIPVTYFDLNLQEDLKLCWNFINVRVEFFKRNKDRGNRLDVLGAKSYFLELYNKTQYPVCQKLLQKLNSIELSEMVSTEGQVAFLKEKREYLQMVENYTSFEFELLNSGRSLEDVEKEITFLRKFR
jgi:hypothetical protein